MTLLKKRHRDYYDLLVEGYSNKEIADKMFVGIKAVKANLSYIYEVYEVKTRAQLIVKHYKSLRGVK